MLCGWGVMFERAGCRRAPSPACASGFLDGYGRGGRHVLKISAKGRCGAIRVARCPCDGAAAAPWARSVRHWAERPQTRAHAWSFHRFPPCNPASKPSCSGCATSWRRRAGWYPSRWRDRRREYFLLLFWAESGHRTATHTPRARAWREGRYGAVAGDASGAGGHGIALALSGVPMGALASPRCTAARSCGLGYWSSSR